MLQESVIGFEVRLYLYCLMTNHIDLVLETPRANLSRFMHRLETAYTIYFNRRHRRSGHLMQGRYTARLVERDAYLLRLSRYAHLNPVFTAAMRSKTRGERVVSAPVVTRGAVIQITLEWGTRRIGWQRGSPGNHRIEQGEAVACVSAVCGGGTRLVGRRVRGGREEFAALHRFGGVL